MRNVANISVLYEVENVFNENKINADNRSQSLLTETVSFPNKFGDEEIDQVYVDGRWIGRTFPQKKSSNIGKYQCTYRSLLLPSLKWFLVQLRKDSTLWKLRVYPRSFYWTWWI